MKLIECVPNFSEGRDIAIVNEIRDAIAAVDGVTVLHVTSDASHNRSVITFTAPYEVMAEAAFAGIRMARDRINLTRHSGVHPRIGAADVVPFIPLDGATMEDCVALARLLGERVGRELGIPVYLYEQAATRPSRKRLEEVRRGGFEKLQREIEVNPERAPDFGPRELHPTAGAVAIGARPFLIAFNVYLGGAENLPIAKEVARAIRTSSGGLPCVKALGLEVDGQAQVSMNLVDIAETPLSTAFEAVRTAAAARGAAVTWSEIIGLIPEQAVFETAARHLRLRLPLDDHILERRILAARHDEDTLRGYLAAIGNGEPTPGGGSVAAYVAALAAALTQMVSNLTLHRDRYVNAHPLMAEIRHEADGIATRLLQLTTRDTEAYAAVMAAYALPKQTDAELSARQWTIQDTLLTAARIPLEVARLCVRIAELANSAATQGNPNAMTDAGTAALLAEAACKSAALNVRANVKALGPVTGTQDLLQDATDCVTRVAQLTSQVTETLQQKLAGEIEAPRRTGVAEP